ncbi:type II secretion system F family protein [Nocardioides sp. NPDC051685]|uniref:type II secretion system F family protein n=1 Tax=Nocardioides sp. NPDC051685 TaxID=3364334 RepID=UPI0037B634CB
MTTTTLLGMMLSGGLIGLGVALLVIWFTPAQPDLADAARRLSPTRISHPDLETGTATGKERLGIWAMRTLPVGLWARTPTRELALLRIPLARFYGDKLIYAALGFVIPIGLTTLLSVMRIPLPFPIPVVACIGLAVVMFFLPNYNAIDDAKRARLEFNRALGAYIDMVALERTNGAGVRRAMETAASVGDSWVFTRLAEELNRSRWSGLPPWDALHTLAMELGLPDLDDFADIMRLSGEEGTATYATLRARTASMRTAMLNDELTEANAINERMSIPGSLLGVIFMAILLAPSLLRMMPS